MAVRAPLASVVDATVTFAPTVTSDIEPLTVFDTATLLGTATVTDPPRVSTVMLVADTAVTVPTTPRPPKPPAGPFCPVAPPPPGSPPPGNPPFPAPVPHSLAMKPPAPVPPESPHGSVPACAWVSASARVFGPEAVARPTRNPAPARTTAPTTAPMTTLRPRPAPEAGESLRPLDPSTRSVMSGIDGGWYDAPPASGGTNVGCSEPGWPEVDGTPGWFGGVGSVMGISWVWAYSYRRASTGSRRDAWRAGHQPARTPTRSAEKKASAMP